MVVPDTGCRGPDGIGNLIYFVSAAHILSIGLLVGAILPLDLRMLGFFRGVPLDVIGPFLSRAAVLGAGMTIVTGILLFTVRRISAAAICVLPAAVPQGQQSPRNVPFSVLLAKFWIWRI